MVCSTVIKMKHQGKCSLNVSANFPLSVFLSLSEDLSFSHSFLKDLQGERGVDILPFHRHAPWRKHTGVISQLCRVMARGNTGRADLFPAVMLLPQKKKAISLWQVVTECFSQLLIFTCFSSHQMAWSIVCPSWGICFFFLFFPTSPVPFDTGLYFPRAIGPNLWGFDGGFSKIFPSKSCQRSLRSVGCHQVGTDIDLVVGKIHHTQLFSTHHGQMR